MLSITNLSSYKSYFKSIAESHKGIQSFVYNNDNNVIDELRSGNAGKPPIMWLEAYEATMNDQKADNFMGMKTGALVILDLPDDNRNIDTVESDCEQIVIDIMSKLLKDYDEGLIRTEFNGFKWATVDPLFTDEFHGVRLEFNYHNPINLIYNPDKWQ